MDRRKIIVGGSAGLLTLASPYIARAQAKEILVGAVYPMSGPSAQIGADSKASLDLAVDIVNNAYADLDLPLAATTGLPNLGGAKIKLVFADHQGDPQKGRSEAERLISQDKVVALIGTYHSSVAATVSVVAEGYGVPFFSAENSSPSLHRKGLKYFFRAAAHDEMFSMAMFDFLDEQKKKGKKIETVAIFYEDTIFGTDSSNVQRKLAAERGYKVVADIKYRANSPSLTTEVQQLKSANADVLLPSSYTTDSILLIKTMAELGYKPKNILAQAAGFSEKALYDAVGDKLTGAITRGSFSLDLAAKRKSVATINSMFKAKNNKDLNDNTSRGFTAMLLLADAINRAKSTDGEAIRAALAATDVPGDKTIMPWKYVKFGADGQNMGADPVLLQYTGGDKFVTVYPAAGAIAEAVWN